VSESQPAKRLCILGSTGSIGKSALAVARALPDLLKVTALAAGSNGEELLKQVREFRPVAVALADEASAQRLRREFEAAGVRLLAGEAGVEELAASPDSDTVLSAVVGAAGLKPTLAAVRAGKQIALANKETIVMAGELFMHEAADRGVDVLPVDSEHSAVFQAMQAGRREEVRKVTLTGSGGPFREFPTNRLKHVTPAEALNHPTWEMGPKITIDSATLMNKALEIIEAHWLFGLEPDQIELVIHPESIVHALVEFADGSIIAQMGVPDMCTPIQYALTWPERRECPSKRLRLLDVGSLRFEAPDLERFPAAALGFETIRRGGTSGAALSAANEVAVGAFLDGKLGFTRIPEVTREVLRNHRFVAKPGLDEILEADRQARALANRML
jgi:1-deoxy-D-xylulose-5-phosphate reductoisomerase